MCGCYKKELLRESYQTSTLALVMPHADFDSFSLDFYPEQPDRPGAVSPRERMSFILNYCRSYCADFDGHCESLLFQGPTGLGKTFLSSCISKELISRGFDIYYETAYNIFALLEKEKFSAPSPEISDAVRRIFECDLLIIDDLGTEFHTPFTTAALYNMINSRILRRAPMIISTNFETAELEKLYSPRIISRLMGEFVLLRFSGEDIRFKISAIT
jgi:DNA replication protein DnaC